MERINIKKVMVILLLALLYGAREATPSVLQASMGIQLVNRAQQAGINARTIYGDEHKNKYLLETTGCGAAFLDYDNDGWQDIFLVNGTRLANQSAKDAPTNRLYRNNGDGSFTDATLKAGLVETGWGQSVSVGD